MNVARFGFDGVVLVLALFLLALGFIGSIHKRIAEPIKSLDQYRELRLLADVVDADKDRGCHVVKRREVHRNTKAGGRAKPNNRLFIA